MTGADIKKADLKLVGRWDKDSRFSRYNEAYNGVTGKDYGAESNLLLTAACRREGYTINCWATYRQWRELGTGPRKGEKGARVYRGSRYWTVFNIEQVRVPDEPDENLLELFEHLNDMQNSTAKSGVTFQDYKGARDYDDIQNGVGLFAR